jgi:hypothetical protein
MLAGLLSIPVMLVLYMFQVGIFSRLPLLSGTADVVLLGLIAWSLNDRVKTAWIWAVVAGLIGAYVSALPMFVPLLTCLVAVGVARLLIRQVWQIPAMAMFFVTFLATLFQHGLSILTLQINGAPISLTQSFSLVFLPSALLNLLLALPVYTFINDLANWLYPVELEA